MHARNCADLVCRASDLSEAASGRFPQTTGRHIGAIGGIAQFAKPIAEAGRGIRFAEMRHQECFNTDSRRRLDDLAQLGMHRDLEVRFLATIRLSLVNGENIE